MKNVNNKPEILTGPNGEKLVFDRKGKPKSSEWIITPISRRIRKAQLDFNVEFEILRPATEQEIAAAEGLPKWNTGCYNDGAEARIVANAPITACPSVDTIGQFAADSWSAGWKDADYDLRKNPISATVAAAEETAPAPTMTCEDVKCHVCYPAASGVPPEPAPRSETFGEKLARLVTATHHGCPTLAVLRCNIERLANELASETARADAAERKRDEFHALLIAAGIDLTQAGKLRNDLATVNQHASELNAELATARQALQEIADENEPNCGCDHSDGSCCYKMGVFCSFCYAVSALNPPTQEKPPNETQA